jgi:hypothetical protein
MHFRALCSQVKNGITFFPKVFPVLKNGQKKCPKTKSQNTFGKKPLPFCDLTDPGLFWSYYVIFVTINGVVTEMIRSN